MEPRPQLKEVVPITIVFPDDVQSQGMTSVIVVQSIADVTAPKLATEINAASSVNVSCYLYSGGVGTATTNKGQAPRRLCTRKQYDDLGNTTYDVTDLQYLWKPQAPSTDTSNKAKAALTPGTTVFLVIRNGLAADTTPIAAADIVDIWKVKLGPQNRGTTGDGEFDRFAITQIAAPVSAPAYDSVVAA